MAKVTSKLQVTIPKVIADAYGIAPGDEIDFAAAGTQIRVVPRGRRGKGGSGSGSGRHGSLSTEERLRLFDAATERQRGRAKSTPGGSSSESIDRGWKRDDLYDRGEFGRGEPD